MKKTTTKKKTAPNKKSTKKVAKRKARRVPWVDRKVSIAAVAKPEEVTGNIPDGFKILHVQPLGVLGGKIWLEVTVVPEG